MTEQAQLFDRRMRHLDEFLKRESIEPIYAHTDMLFLVMYTYHTALGTRNLCCEMERQLDLEVYTRYYLHHWQDQIEKWQQQLREVPRFNVADKTISGKRRKRLALVVSALTTREDSRLDDLTIDDIHEDFLPEAGEMTFGVLIGRLEKTLGMLQASVDQLISIPQSDSISAAEALQRYTANPIHRTAVQEERSQCRRYFAQSRNRTQGRMLLYLRERLQALVGESQLGYVSLSPSEQDAYIQRFAQTCFPESLLFPEPQGLPNGKQPLADRELVARLLYFLDLDKGDSFPELDAAVMVDYLTCNDFRSHQQEEQRLVRLMALLQELKPIVADLRQVKSETGSCACNPAKDNVYALVCKSNASLQPFLAKGRTLEELNRLFHQWLYADAAGEQSESQQQLCQLLRSGNHIQLKYYLYLLHEASDHHQLLLRNDFKAISHALDPALFGYADPSDMPTEKSFQRYLSASSHNDEPQWQPVETYLELFR